MALPRNLVGLRFTLLTVMSFSRQVQPDYSHRRRYWNCRCDCGVEKEIVQDSLVGGMARSCGCAKGRFLIESKGTHGMTNTPTHKIWLGIKKRCYQVNSEVYYKYGGRGIRMSDEWRDSFKAFLRDMGERPLGLTIERKNVNGNYEAGNCCWITALSQGSNKRNTVHAFPGESLRQTAIRFGVNYKYLHKLYRTDGLPIDQAIAKARSSKSDRTRSIALPTNPLQGRETSVASRR